MCSRSWRSVEMRARILLGRPVSTCSSSSSISSFSVVDQVEVALGDLVDEAEQVHADGLVRAARVLGRLRVERLLAGRRLRDRHELLGREDEVDLLVVDAILVGNGDRDEQHADDVVAVRLDPRARLVVVDERRGQQLERRRMDARRAGARSSSSAVGSSRSIQRGARHTPRLAARSAGPTACACAGSASGAARSSAVPAWPSSSARYRSASRAPIQPDPAAVTACGRRGPARRRPRTRPGRSSRSSRGFVIR